MPFDDETKEICRENLKEMVDLRPYMQTGPHMVFTTDHLQKCVDIFRKMHLRHLLVVHPSDGKMKGIITRQDLFAWLDL